jgi:hypothetical protein
MGAACARLPESTIAMTAAAIVLRISKDMFEVSEQL